MIADPHDLAHELPEHREQIMRLQARDADFRQLLASYNMLDRELQDIQLSGTPIDDRHFETLKKRRLALKDTLFERVRLS